MQHFPQVSLQIFHCLTELSFNKDASAEAFINCKKNALIAVASRTYTSKLKLVCPQICQQLGQQSLQNSRLKQRAGSHCRDLNSICGSALHPVKCQTQKLYHLCASDSQSRNTLCDFRESTRCNSNAFQYSNLIKGVECIFSSVDMLRHLKNSEKALWSSPSMGSKCLISMTHFKDRGNT